MISESIQDVVCEQTKTNKAMQGKDTLCIKESGYQVRVLRERLEEMWFREFQGPTGT